MSIAVFPSPSHQWQTVMIGPVGFPAMDSANLTGEMILRKLRHLMPAPHYLLLGWLLINQTGCLTVTDRVIPGTTLRQEAAVSQQGPPEAHMLIHPEHQGWTITLTQPITRHVEVIRSERKEQHSYYPNPFAVPAGVFACPSSAWGWFWNAVATVPDAARQLEQRKALLDFTFTSCLIALSIACFQNTSGHKGSPPDGQ